MISINRNLKVTYLKLYFIVYICLTWQQCCDGLKLPDYIKACSVSDPKVKECMKQHAQDALPKIAQGDSKYHVPSLTPMEIEEILLEGSNTITLVLKDVKVYGLEDSEFLAGDLINKDNQYIVKYRMKIPSLVLLSNYNVKGHILVIPITGNGPSNITLVGNVFDSVHTFNIKEHKGKQYLDLAKEELEFECERVYFDLKNLLGTNNQLGAEVNKQLNDNWQLIVNDLKPAIVEAMKAIVRSVFIGYTDHIPIDDLFLPE